MAKSSEHDTESKKPNSDSKGLIVKGKSLDLSPPKKVKRASARPPKAVKKSSDSARSDIKESASNKTEGRSPARSKPTDLTSLEADKSQSASKVSEVSISLVELQKKIQSLLAASGPAGAAIKSSISVADLDRAINRMAIYHMNTKSFFDEVISKSDTSSFSGVLAGNKKKNIRKKGTKKCISDEHKKAQ
ncbi:hypothetical protein [Pseudomonas sp. 25 E 4]|uniref:hypothetical protein n=1 Tax=Pseudomonas sp. 25 E 4 TaxID=1844097 RepID=UPI0008124D54|nr:hypothetical protein [Pseudomonas sp. 25 E 4]CRM28301.1 hypothetical protein [Pseudomonas sp. 25 E 4]